MLGETIAVAEKYSQCGCCGVKSGIKKAELFGDVDDVTHFLYAMVCNRCLRMTKLTKQYNISPARVEAVANYLEQRGNGIDHSCNACGTTEGNIPPDVDEKTRAHYGYLCTPCHRVATLARKVRSNAPHIRKIAKYLENRKAPEAIQALL